MKIIIPGHKYKLDSFHGYEDQTLCFIHKEPKEVLSDQYIPGITPVEFRTVQDGTTNEEVLRVLIDRIRFLNEKMPCRENSIVLTKLEESLMWLERRTSLRQQQNVEGKQIMHSEK